MKSLPFSLFLYSLHVKNHNLRIDFLEISFVMVRSSNSSKIALLLARAVLALVPFMLGLGFWVYSSTDETSLSIHALTRFICMKGW